MKKIGLFAVLCALISSCGKYQYYPAPVYAPAFANQFETQVNTNMGAHGFAASTGFAITKRMLIAGQYNSTAGIGDLFCKEGETSAGFNVAKFGTTHFNIYAGCGFGSLYKQDSGSTIKDFGGKFSKPFTVFSFNTASTTNRRVKADAIIGLKFNYFIYDGFRTEYDTSGLPYETNYDREHFFYEMFFGGNFGGKHVRFNTGMGLALKRVAEIGEGVKIFPVHFTIGLTFLFGRKYEQEPLPPTNGGN
jgi:hypothetical protein